MLGFGTDKRTAHLPGDARAWGHLDRFLIGSGTAAEVFGRIYQRGLWGHGLLSGGGSQPIEALPYLDLVNGLIAVAGWRKVVDLGCGDGWITQRLQADHVSGVDVFPAHLEKMRRDVPGREWLALDIDADRERLPSGDVALVKDLIHHWPSALLLGWIAFVRASGKYRWLVLTYDSANAVDGANCPLGGYRPLRADLAPLSGVKGLRVLASYLHKQVGVVDCR